MSMCSDTSADYPTVSLDQRYNTATKAFPESWGYVYFMAEYYITTKVYNIIRNEHENPLGFACSQVSDIVSVDEKSLTLTMELAPGFDLQKHINHIVNYRCPRINDIEILRICMLLASTLEAMHKNKITHGDVKPENVMYDYKHGTVTLIDFGLSTIDSNAVKNTSVFCMTPEQLNKKIKYIGPKVDVWGLGALMYFMKYHTDPFANNQDILDIKYNSHDDSRNPVDIIIRGVLTVAKFRPTMEAFKYSILNGMISADRMLMS
jgi:serine/threonine protein kinase